MALTTGDRDLVVKAFRDYVHGILNLTAHWSIAQLRAAVDAADAVLDLQASQLTQNQTVLQNLNAALPEPFKTQATTGQKWVLLQFIAGRRGSL